MGGPGHETLPWSSNGPCQLEGFFYARTSDIVVCGKVCSWQGGITDRGMRATGGRGVALS